MPVPPESFQLYLMLVLLYACSNSVKSKSENVLSFNTSANATTSE